MIVTNHFVYIHTSRSAGTFLNKLILEHVPGARMLQYHGLLRDLPDAYSHLPIIGFVRNPWDWYVSMYFDYKRKQQYVFQIISEGGTLEFEPTIARFLRLGDGSVQSKRLLEQIVSVAPDVINAQTPRGLGNSGLLARHFANFPDNLGYYSWLVRLMYQSRRAHNVHFGRFENLREEALRLFTVTGTPITEEIASYLRESRAQNSSRRPKDFTGGYSAELRQLVAEKDQSMLHRFGYDFSTARQYPKTDSFNRIGSADISALLERVRDIPESQWNAENEYKPNKYAQLNDTRHVMFRFVKQESMFDYYDCPLWDEWKDVVLPVMEQAAKGLGYKNYRFPRVMLARLPAGGEISTHIDREASSYSHKIHVPLITNPETRFSVGKEDVHLPAGDIVEVNNKRLHGAKNAGKNDRVHLIFECYNIEDYGKAS